MSGILVIIAVILGKKSILKRENNIEYNRPLYDEETLIIMRNYELITDDQYKEMINLQKENI